MVKTMVALVGGVLLGILVMLAVGRFAPPSNPSPDEIIRDIVDVQTMTQAVAEKHREERYARLTGIEELFALPTEFARSEALYSLAGGSDSAGVQKWIFEANRIADDVGRADLLNILFFRLAEIDPQSALALARSDHFTATKSIEQTVWRAWARKDLQDALFAAKSQTSVAHENLAAQALYAAFGYMGNETTEYIQAELGIGPDRSSRSRFLYLLADKSPATAIAFINGLERGTEQQEFVSWLADHLSLRDPTAALGFTDLFQVASNGERYSSIISSTIARENPQATIERLLASGEGINSNYELHSAIGALASIDLDRAKQYFEHSRSIEDQRIFGSAIATELAKADPNEALTWARANDRGEFPYLQMTVLVQITETDPQLALAEALKTPNVQSRSSMISNVVQNIARNNPADAVNYVAQIESRQHKLKVGKTLASVWIRQDPDAAIDWILAQDKEMAGQMINEASHRLVRSNVDAAIRLLPRFDQQNQQTMRLRIAQTLATGRSLDEAQSFIRQYEGQPGYYQLQASVISGIAQTDVLTAKQLADQLANEDARDTAYTQVISQRAQTDPAEAVRWLRNIKNENTRGTVAGQIASNWYANDPVAAARWVSDLPGGTLRDDAIMQMSSQWRDPTAEQQQLIASIEDRDKRGHAKIRQIYNVMRADPAKARKLLEDEDISAYQRQQVETMLSQYGLRF